MKETQSTDRKFKYSEVEDRLAGYVRETGLSIGDRLPAMRRLSSEMRVSMVTLRRAIGNLRKSGVLVSRQGSGVYVANPDRDLVLETEVLTPVPGRMTVCIVDAFAKGDHANRLSNSFVLGKTVEGARRACLKHRCGLRLLSFVHDEGLAEALGRILSARDRLGLLINAPQFQTVLGKVGQRDIPWVAMGLPGERACEYEARPDFFEAGRLVGDYLGRLGHADVLYMGIDPQAGKISSEIHAGFCFGHRRASPRSLIDEVFIPYVMDMHRHEEVFRAGAVRALSKMEGVSAAFICADGIAAVTVPYLLQHGIRIPQTLSLVTLDDSRRCLAFTPTWTSVSLDLDRVTELAVEAIVRWEEGSARSPFHLVAPPRLVVRDSCVARKGAPEASSRGAFHGREDGRNEG